MRRRYQRSNRRFQFTASQIERIEREEERERRAQKLREREKKRLSKKKKKAEKEAKAREERKRLGLPDPNAPRVPSSQPLLVNFLAPTKKESAAAENDAGSEEATELDISGDTEAELDSCVEDADGTLENNDSSALATGDECRISNDEEDEFSDCSIFYDEEIIRKVEAGALHVQQNAEQQQPMVITRDDEGVEENLSVGDSFHDETAVFLEQAFSHEFDTDDDFESELIKLSAVVDG